MASKITAIFVLLALFALQGTNASVVSDVTQKIEAGINSAVANINSTLADFKGKIENSTSALKEKVEEAVSSVGTTIADAEAKAKAAGVAVSECTNGTQDKVQGVRNATRDSLQQCASTAQQEVQPDVDAVQESIQLLNSTGRDMIRNLTACGWNVICQGQAAIKGNLQISQRNIQLLNSTVQLEKDAPQAAVSAVSCGQASVTSGVSDVQQIGNTTVTCITDKINATTSEQ